MRFRDDRRLPGDAESVRADRLDVFRSPDEQHVVSARKQSSDEAAHRARTEDEDLHDW